MALNFQSSSLNVKLNCINDSPNSMKLVSKNRFEIGIHKAGAWYWRPTWSGGCDNFHSMENGVGFMFVNTRSYFVQTTIQLFFLKFIFYIKIKPELLSGELPCRYVRIEDTHLDLLSLPHGSWADKKN